MPPGLAHNCSGRVGKHFSVQSSPVQSSPAQLRKKKVFIRSTSYTYNISLMAGVGSRMCDAAAEGWTGEVGVKVENSPQSNDYGWIREWPMTSTRLALLIPTAVHD